MFILTKTIKAGAPAIPSVFILGILGILVLWAGSCVPPEVIDHSITEYRLDDPKVQHIIRLQDERKSDSLIAQLHNPYAYIRLLTLRALGNCKDSNSVDSILPLLQDPVEEVKAASAFALGLIGSKRAEQALIEAFHPVDSSGTFLYTNKNILEALGRCGSDSTLELICNISSYTEKDTHYLEGQLMSIYRFGLRGKFCASSTKKLAEIACNKSYPESVRLIAAHSLMRFKEHDVKAYFDLIKNACYEEKNPDIRMCLVIAFSRIAQSTVLAELEELYRRGLDLRVQNAIIRGLSHFTDGRAAGLASKALQNPSTHVAIQGAQYFLDYGQEIHEDMLASALQQGGQHWQVKAMIYEALLKIVPAYKVLTRNGLISQVKLNIAKAKNPYEKSSYIRALSGQSKELYYLIELGNSGKNEEIVITTLTETILKIVKRSNFGIIFPGPKNYAYTAVSQFLTNSCSQLKLGSISLIADAFTNNELFYLKKYFKADSIFSELQNKLQLPKDIETFNDVSKAISKLKKIPVDIRKAPYNHPIPWELYQEYGDSIRLEMLTDKGLMELELYSNLAPGSVFNMIKLVREKYFDQKFIHRVVPNFVIQSGCPLGDGYGSLDYSIRTEISASASFNSAGMIGMASSGMDTECSQFFISYTATPHLDGNYTIFGKLVKGFDVLNAINAGDQIKEMRIIDSQKK